MPKVSIMNTTSLNFFNMVVVLKFVEFVIQRAVTFLTDVFKMQWKRKFHVEEWRDTVKIL